MVSVAIGSENPIKIKAAKDAFSQLIPQEQIIYYAENCSSGVSHTPFSDEEMINGAYNRAKAIRLKMNTNYGVGIEGGIAQVQENYFLKAWVVVIGEDGKSGLGSSPSIMIPKKWAERVLSGEELGDIVADTTNRPNIKQREGAFGILTNNQITRLKSLELAVISALSVIQAKFHYS